jgi:hypothetical protein
MNTHDRFTSYCQMTDVRSTQRAHGTEAAGQPSRGMAWPILAYSGRAASCCEPLLPLCSAFLSPAWRVCSLSQMYIALPETYFAMLELPTLATR